MEDDEFDSFMERVTEVESLVRQMRCPDSGVVERARREAREARESDLLLGSTAGEGPDRPDRADRGLQDGHQDGHGDARPPRRKDRTVINHRAFERMSDDPAAMSKEAFMAEVERDAENRAKDRRERRRRSDELKSRANQAFRLKQFEKALDFYNKAIDETRDSAVLHENRALTCLNLELYKRTIEDCDQALRLNEGSLKALLYKAKALHRLKEEVLSEKCLSDAVAKHPQHQDMITEYKATWINGKQL